MGNFPAVHGGTGFSSQHKTEVVEAEFPRQPLRRTLFPQVYSLELARQARLEWLNRMEDRIEHTRRAPLSPLLPAVLWAGACAAWFAVAWTWWR